MHWHLDSKDISFAWVSVFWYLTQQVNSPVYTKESAPRERGQKRAHRLGSNVFSDERLWEESLVEEVIAVGHQETAAAIQGMSMTKWKRWRCKHKQNSIQKGSFGIDLNDPGHRGSHSSSQLQQRGTRRWKTTPLPSFWSRSVGSHSVGSGSVGSGSVRSESTQSDSWR